MLFDKLTNLAMPPLLMASSRSSLLLLPTEPEDYDHSFEDRESDAGEIIPVMQPSTNLAISFSTHDDKKMAPAPVIILNPRLHDLRPAKRVMVSHL